MTGEKPKLRKEEIEQIRREIREKVLEFLEKYGAKYVEAATRRKTEIWRSIPFSKPCPDCLEPLSSIAIKFHYSNIYVYLRHSKKHKCYFGTFEYKYVTRTHNDIGLVLKGKIEWGRYIEYVAKISENVKNIEDIETLKQLEKVLEEALAAVRRQIEIVS